MTQRLDFQTFLFRNDFFINFHQFLDMSQFIKLVQSNRDYLDMTGGKEMTIIIRTMAKHLYCQAAISFLYHYLFVSYIHAPTQPRIDVVRLHVSWFIRQPFLVRDTIEAPVYRILTETWRNFRFDHRGVEFFASEFREFHFQRQAVYLWNKTSFKSVLLHF